MYGVKTAQAAKDYLELELEGFVVDFDPSHVSLLLHQAAPPSVCENYFKSQEAASGGFYSGGQWTKIPDSPNKEDDLYKPLVETVQSVLAYFKLDASRQVRDTHVSTVTTDNVENLKACPDIFISGDGKHFQGTISDNTWQQSISTVEVKTESTKSNNKTWLGQTSHYARQTLVAQPTRMFAYGLLLTEKHVQLNSFDRCGAQRSLWMDYRSEPQLLIQVLLLVCNRNLEKLGIDSSVSFVDSRLQFNMVDNGTPVVYTADPKPRFQTFFLRGRATVCWSVMDEDGNTYVLKQQFVSASRTNEEETLRRLQGKRIQGIGMPIFSQRFGLVSVSRGMEQPVHFTFHDRYMYRLVLEEHGDTIDNVPNRMALLVALRNAIAAHRSIWYEKILHRDISTNNILYTKNEHGEPNTRGVLIDFDLSVDITRTPSNFLADFRNGTRAFQSYSVLISHIEENPEVHVLHDYLDDLESFYWVFIWITRGQVAPEKRKRTPLVKKLEVHQHFLKAAEDASAKKLEMLVLSAATELQPGWGPAYLKLARDLGAYLYRVVVQKTLQTKSGRAWSPEELIANAPAHYEDVLGHFDVAIEHLKVEMTPSESPSLHTPFDDIQHAPSSPDQHQQYSVPFNINPTPSPEPLSARDRLPFNPSPTPSPEPLSTTHWLPPFNLVPTPSPEPLSARDWLPFNPSPTPSPEPPSTTHWLPPFNLVPTPSPESEEPPACDAGLDVPSSQLPSLNVSRKIQCTSRTSSKRALESENEISTVIDPQSQPPAPKRTKPSLNLSVTAMAVGGASHEVEGSSVPTRRSSRLAKRGNADPRTGQSSRSTRLNTQRNKNTSRR